MAYKTYKCNDRKYSFKLLYLSSDANSLLWFLKMECVVRGNQGIPSIGLLGQRRSLLMLCRFTPLLCSSSTTKMTIFWLAKEISTTCSGDHLNHCTNLLRKSMSTTIFKNHGPWRDLLQACLMSVYFFCYHSTKGLRFLGQLPLSPEY
jgi:hypothetical protein